MMNTATSASMRVTGRLTWPRALIGGIYTAVSYALMTGHRDFTSRSAIVPSRFEVLVAATHSDRAHTLLTTSPR